MVVTSLHLPDNPLEGLSHSQPTAHSGLGSGPQQPLVRDDATRMAHWLLNDGRLARFLGNS